jgi:NTE family protein
MVFDIIVSMNYKQRSLGLLLAGLAAIFILRAVAADAQEGVEKARPKVGLVLSGGGAKGFAHIGALKVIEEAGLKVDYIAGTSMGAIIGALYAMGYSPAQIEQIALGQNWNELFDDAASRRYLPMAEKPRQGIYIANFPIRKGRVDMPSGLISGQKLQSLLARLAWPAGLIDDFNDLPIPFCCLATDLETGRPVILDRGSLPQAVRASMSIPTIFAPMRIGEQLLIDGGIVDNLPARQARAMGAEVLVGVDVSVLFRTQDQLGSLIEILDQTISFQGYASVEEQRRLCQTLIIPELPRYTSGSFSRVGEIIKKGEEAARRSLPELERMVDSLGLRGRRETRMAPALPESICLGNIGVEGLSRVSKELVLDELDLKDAGRLSAAELDRAIDRVYSTQFFERVSYRLAPAGAGVDLRVNVIEKEQQTLGLGFRYDSNTNAELLAGFNLRNLLGHSSLLAADLRLGDSPELNISEYIHAGIGPGLGVRVNLNAVQFPVYLYQQEQRWASLNYRLVRGEIFLGSIYSKVLELGGGLKMEYFRSSPDIAPVGFAGTRDHHLTMGLSLDLDTYDRSEFPTRGQKLTLSHTLANRQFGGRADFYRKSGRWQGRFPVNKKLSLGHEAFWGNISGREVPTHYRFYLGGLDQRQGVISLAGLKPMELNGSNVMGLGIGAQYEAWTSRFLAVSWNIAKAGDGCWKDQFTEQGLVSGVSFGAGILTPAGPLRLDLMGGSRHSFLAHLRLGCNF